MEVIVKRVITKDYLTKSNLPASDFVINPYVGCPHACKYCYASFMKRFTGHTENWGSFIDIKECEKAININRIKGKSVFLSSVTDCYNPFEEQYGVTGKILEQLVDAECELTISTKSKLVVRDIYLLKKFPNLKVAISINTLDEEFRADMDCASSISDRLEALQELHQAGIHTVLFMSPIFPYITDWKAIIRETKDYVNEYWFENLNLRGAYKKAILQYIDSHYPMRSDVYKEIYIYKDEAYWEQLAHALEEYCNKESIRFKNYFYHEKLVKEKNIENRTRCACL